MGRASVRTVGHRVAEQGREVLMGLCKLFVCSLDLPTCYKTPMRDFEEQRSKMTPNVSLTPGAELYIGWGGLLKS